MSQIDNAIKNVYSGGNYGELQALAKLTDKSILNAVRSELASKSGSNSIINVDFEWIDKIPVAKFCGNEVDINNNKITQRVEIGDMFIKYNHYIVSDNGGEIIKDCIRNQEVVVQAKVTDKKDFNVPITPLTTKSSTVKELKLLEEWSSFDLYKTARNKSALQSGLDIEEPPFRNPKARPFALFGGYSNTSKDWKFGNAINGEKCLITFSKLINGLYSGSYGKSTLTTPNDKDWNRLSSEIDKLCSSTYAPKSLFGTKVSRVKRVTTYIDSEGLQYNKYYDVTDNRLLFQGNKILQNDKDTTVAYEQGLLDGCLYCCSENIGFDDKKPDSNSEDEKRFLVLKINRVDDERV